MDSECGIAFTGQIFLAGQTLYFHLAAPACSSMAAFGMDVRAALMEYGRSSRTRPTGTRKSRGIACAMQGIGPH
jgi:hypothetical protein